MTKIYGAIEAGGTKFVCGVGAGPEDLETVRIPTTSPETTVGAAIAFLRERRPAAVGIGSFGPVDLETGHIAATPKAGWAGYDFAGTVARALGVPVAFDTDVNAAALGEARWGAGRGLSDSLYLTVGTGIGGGALINGQLLHGKQHPEMGHIGLPHDLARDPFPGCCPYHGDCLEGLASGPAMEARWGMPAEKLPPDHPGWVLEAGYLALGLAAFACTLSPQRIILGGGVMEQPGLRETVRGEFGRLLGGYIQPCDVVPPGLGARAGVLGALALAMYNRG